MDTPMVFVNGEERPLPKVTTLAAVIDAYTTQPEGDPILVRHNGKVINSLLDDCDCPVDAGDRIDIFPLVLGG